MELWCECLGRERQDMRKSDAYELEAILQQVGGWDVYRGNTTGKMRLPGYGVQKTFVRQQKKAEMGDKNHDVGNQHRDAD